MRNLGTAPSNHGLDKSGIQTTGDVFWNLSTPVLYEHIIRRGEGKMVHLGPLVVSTGEYTGRSPKDKYVVEEPSSSQNIWWGDINQPISQATFEKLRQKQRDYLADKDVYVFDGYAGADSHYRLPVRIVTQYAWHNLFARNMFIQEHDLAKLAVHVPGFTVINTPGLFADPEQDGTRSKTFIIVNFAEKVVLVGGTEYAGEIKKSIFTALNYYLPLRDTLSMHCSANYGADKEDTAIFFGLSGTGKTTLSNDSTRSLIGDDEHGWSDSGVFNFEGGCYAKMIRLDPEGEPEIYSTTRKFGTILENIVYDADTRRIDLDDDRYTQNTRAVYPIAHIDNADRSGLGGHPRNVVFLTADAFGILPPISRLTKAQAMYHFLSGYTAKVAGTERGVTEPRPEFSACFGAPFLPLHPGAYAELLGKRIEEHQANVWLVNTGWTGGPYGVGNRMKLAHTRRMIAAILAGDLDECEMDIEPFFNLSIPKHVLGVPDTVLNPRNTWADGQEYDAAAEKLVSLFIDNFTQYADGVSAEVLAASPGR